MEDQYSLLVCDDDQTIRDLLATILVRAGYAVQLAADGAEALQLATASAPDLIITDVEMPMSGLDLVTALRLDVRLRTVPVIFLSSKDSTEDIVVGLVSGGDDYVTKPFDPTELLARVASKLARPPVPRDLIASDSDPGLIPGKRFDEEVERELVRFQRGGKSGAMCRVVLLELAGIELRFGRSVAEGALRDVSAQIVATRRPLDLLSRGSGYELRILMPDTDDAEAARELESIVRFVTSATLEVSSQPVRATPASGFAAFDTAGDASDVQRQAGEALEFAVLQGDLRPVRWTEAIGRWAAAHSKPTPGKMQRWASMLRLPVQLVMMVLVGGVTPFLAYVLLDRAGHDISAAMYIVVVVALVTTGGLIWLEGLRAFSAPDPPELPGEPYPTATAIIAAYLPNEAATIRETVDVFLKLDYPGELEVILAYNSPTTLAVEAELAELARSNRRFRAIRVEHSDSKAQNINAVLGMSRGRFVGIFDADHHPRPDSFARAWRWLSNGYDVVQGHCLVRNGGSSRVARMVAVEFESIYAVSHPGRARLHGFGIFGGSNGFWRTDQLHQIRMRSSMLTEDIDSSIRVLEAGGRIASDPGLVSTELATTTLRQTWNQRMRWAQGWFQVSLAHYLVAMRSRRLSLREKLALTQLLVWREVYPWISVQMFPLIAFWIVRDGGPGNIDWFVPIFVLTTLFTLSVGPGQTVLAYLRADPQIRQHRAWFIGYLFFSSLFYTEFKNVVARVAQIKELMGERDWRVTPRDVADVEATEQVAA